MHFYPELGFFPPILKAYGADAASVVNLAVADCNHNRPGSAPRHAAFTLRNGVPVEGLTLRLRQVEQALPN
jgi:hypothetical protein